MANFVLYHYWRSSSSYRMRIALALKGVSAKLVAVDLLAGENESIEHRARNPMGYVPVLTIDGRAMIESMAIIEWLDETHPSPSFFPGDSFDRQHVRSLCELINAGTQPLHNAGIAERHSTDKREIIAWNSFFIRKGLGAYQSVASARAGRFSFGDRLTAAELFLVPLCYAANRFHVDVDREFPLLAGWNREALAVGEVAASHPDKFKP